MRRISSYRISWKRVIISSTTCGESHSGNSTGKRVAWRPRTLNGLVSPLRMSKSSQQIGQHRFDTTMNFWSMLCKSYQINEHHHDASKHYLHELSQNGILDRICGR